jgi:hypothetical protein
MLSSRGGGRTTLATGHIPGDGPRQNMVRYQGGVSIVSSSCIPINPTRHRNMVQNTTSGLREAALAPASRLCHGGSRGSKSVRKRFLKPSQVTKYVSLDTIVLASAYT